MVYSFKVHRFSFHTSLNHFVTPNFILYKTKFWHLWKEFRRKWRDCKTKQG